MQTAKAFLLRADVLRSALQSPVYKVPATHNHFMVISDYCYSHTLKESVRALTEAILLAGDHRSLEMLVRFEPALMNEVHVRGGFCTRLLLTLLKREESKENHIRFLLMDMPIASTEPPFDGSKVSVSTLLKKKCTSAKILDLLFGCGMKCKLVDIALATETLPGDSVSTLNALCKRCDGKPSDTIGPIAVQHKKFKFVLFALKQGCALPCTSQELLTSALQKNTADIAESFLPFCNLSEVDLGLLMSTHLINHSQLLGKMIDEGVDPNGLGEKKPLNEVQQSTQLSTIKRMDLVCMLLQKGSDCQHLCLGSKYQTTPVHIATSVSLNADGDTRVLNALVACKSFSMPPSDGKLVDGKGRTPLHLAMQSQWKRDHSLRVLKALIETHQIPIDPLIQDDSHKKATDFLMKNDKRAPILALAAKRLQQKTNGKKTKKRTNGKSERSGQKNEELSPPADTQPKPESDKSNKPPASYETMSLPEKLEHLMKKVLGKKEDYFVMVAVPTEAEKTPEKTNGTSTINEKTNENENVGKNENDEVLIQEVAVEKETSPQPNLEKEEEVEVEADIGEDGMNAVMRGLGFDGFDGLPWEVEVTTSVLKFFKNEKRHPPKLRLQAARTLYKLAEGRRSKDLSKEVSNLCLSLFEARMTRGGRILWQKAVQFSPRRTEQSSNPIYAQVIRIWEIVPNHDQLNPTIQQCIERIELSNERGLKASLHVSLMPQGKKKPNVVRQQETLEIPLIFTQTDINSEDPHTQLFTPAASPKDDEFNVTTFYSFSWSVLKSMLTSCNARRDFPFKEWPKEHEIINLSGNESILLLGRSGTGKTTCCLYRLWNEFKNYWDPELYAFIAMLPRKPLVTLKVWETLETPISSSGELDGTGDADKEHLTENGGQLSYLENGVFEEMEEEEEEEEEEESDCEYNCADGEFLPDGDGGECVEVETSENEEAGTKEIYEHLHQVFVTKNYVLCAMMKKRFYDLAASHDFLNDHLDYELKDIPHSFGEIEDHAYPLFLTARQFYILLDNSIGKGECFFRPREKDGSLKVKILSTDYDHEDPDTLLDLEESESEDEEVANPTNITTPMAAKQQALKYVEVTSLYFTDTIWPAISHKCDTKHLDPLLVWIEIQSFIKGSRLALQKGSALDLEDYLQIGNKMAPNFANEREKIYKLFKSYEEYCQNQRHSTFLFDECDLVRDIYQRLRSTQDLPWSIHSLYIDEVQDFTQAELTLYLHCCRDPNSFFFTGDTAQSIMRGIAFRFQDLRSAFYAIHQVVPQVKVPQKPHTLTINFRSHSGILQLAGSVIDLIQAFFASSIDHLPEDKGMFPGPTPVILESCDESDLALLLSSNRRDCSRIEFGAHQVVLVQSKEAKDNLPSILKGAIVLTIFESKGLEFDDVLLYNFFKDSMVDERGWRVITTYLEDHPSCIKLSRRFPGATSDPRSNKFDEKSHKALNSELKYLYTAITRAKCNLWIYDSDQKKRLPMFNLWYKQDLVKVVGNELDGAESQHSLIFASISTRQQWKVQGDYFMRRSRWEQAKHCYERAGAENAFLSVEANARLLIQKARRESRPQFYLEAAVNFLRSDELLHNVQCLMLCAQCLRRAKPPKYAFAGKLFEKLEKNGEAIKCYRKAKDIPNCVRLLEKEGRYSDAVKAYKSPKDSLSKASEYAAKGIQLPVDLMPNTLSYTYAKRYANRKDKTLLLEVLVYMPDVHRRVRFLKEGGFYDKAFDAYVEHSELDDAYRLASGQCLFTQGMQVALRHHNAKKHAEFVFHQIHANFFLSVKDGERVLPEEFRSQLHSLLSAKDPTIKAHACLLLGISEKDASLCRTAHKTFLDLRNRVAALEAFNALSLVKMETSIDVELVLESCITAKEVQNALVNYSDLNQLVKQAASLYGLQKVRDVYLTPPNHNMWLSPQFEQCLVTSDDQRDPDGMLKLQNNATREVMASRVARFIKEWSEKYKLLQEIYQKMVSFELHDEISKKRFLLQIYSPSKALVLKEYIKNVIHYCELGFLQNQSRLCNTAISILLTIFSPQVSIYLPLRKNHVTVVRSAVSTYNAFQEKVKNYVDNELNHMDAWFSAWRACAICASTDEDKTEMVKALEKLEKRVNDNYSNRPVSPPASNAEEILTAGAWKGNKFEAPFSFIYWESDNYYYHVFNCWIYSCQLIRLQKKPMFAAKQAIYHFLGTISQRKILTISVMNLVDVLIVHSMSLFAMLTHINHFRRQQTKFLVPTLYKDCVQLFNDLNCRNTGDTWLFKACADEVRNSIRWKRDDRLISDGYKLLMTALRILLGTYRRDTQIPVESQKKFKVLAVALRNEKALSSGASQHCLVLALTLFANLMPVLPEYTVHGKFHSVQEIFEKFAQLFYQVSQQPFVPPFLKQGIALFKFPIPHKNVLQQILFQYIGHLLSDGQPSGGSTQAMMLYDEKKKIHFIFLPSADVRHSQPRPREPGFDKSSMSKPRESYSHSVSPGPPLGLNVHPEAMSTPPVFPHPPAVAMPHQTLPSSATTLWENPGYMNNQLSEELPRLETPLETEQLSNEHHLEVMEDTQVVSTSTMVEEEDEDEVPGSMSSMQNSIKPSQEAVIDPELINPNIVSGKSCDVCGVGLRKEFVEDEEETEMQVQVDHSLEAYGTHVRSEQHARNVTLHNKFREDYNSFYNTMAQELKDLIQQCEQLQASQLVQVIDDIKEALDRYDRKISGQEEHLQWENGIKTMGEAVEKFQHFLTLASSEYQKLIDAQPQEQGPMRPGIEDEAGEDSETEFDVELNRREVEIDDCTLVPRTEETKKTLKGT